MSRPSRRTASSAPPRVVLDTNVVLSALVFSGDLSVRLRSAWQTGACRPLICTATAHELIRVLAYPKFRLSADEQEELLADYLPYATSVRIPQPEPVVPVCRDPFDIAFLHLAVVGNASRLVTGDLDLLALAGQTQFAIVGLVAFLDSL